MSKKNRFHSKQKSIQQKSVLVDVVIPVRGKHDFLDKCLTAIPAAMGNLSYHIWIIDNGSKVEDVQYYRKHLLNKTISTTIHPQGIGFPMACNFGARQGNAPLILILNSDVFLEPNSVEYLVKEMDDPKTGIVAPKLLFPEGSPNGPAGKIQHVGIELNIRAELYHQFIGWSPDNPRVIAKKESFAVTGAAFMTRRNIWTTIKGFNTVYGLGTYEDCEFSIQVRKLGYNIRISHEAIGYHWVNASAIDAGVQYPLNENKHIFMSRNGNNLLWSEYLWW